jgi:hypothetical protein
VNRPVLLDSSYLIDLERETAADEVGPAHGFLPSLRGRPVVVSIVSVEDLWRGRSMNQRPSPPCSALRFRDFTWRKPDAAPSFSGERPDVWGRTTRGWSRPQSRSTRTLLEQTARRSNASARAICGFAE